MNPSIPLQIPRVFAFALMPLFVSATTRAAVVVYEDFSYASLVNNATLNGVATEALGLTGNYAVSNQTGGSATYLTTGLTFSSSFFATAGGAANLAAPTNTAFSLLGAGLNAGTVTGSLYSSYLVQFSSLSGVAGSLGTQRINSGATAGSGSSWFRSDAESSAAVSKPGVGYNSGTTDYAGSSTLTLNTTYVVVSRFTNVGTALSVGSPGVADLWMLTSADYDGWLDNGALESELSTFATFTATETITSGSASTFTFDNSRFVQFGAASSGGSQVAIFDELRYGTTLADVAVVPEPLALPLLAAGLALCLSVQRGRRREGIFATAAVTSSVPMIGSD